jgi:hypothetical protein
MEEGRCGLADPGTGVCFAPRTPWPLGLGLAPVGRIVNVRTGGGSGRMGRSGFHSEAWKGDYEHVGNADGCDLALRPGLESQQPVDRCQTIGSEPL